MALYRKNILIKLKNVTSKLISLCGGMQESSSVNGVRVGKTQLCKYAKQDCHDVFITVDQVAMLERYCQSPIITKVLAKNLGYKLQKISDKQCYNNSNAHQDIMSSMANALRLLSDMMYIATISMDYISSNNRVKIYNDIMHHMHCLQDALDDIQSKLSYYIDYSHLYDNSGVQ